VPFECPRIWPNQPNGTIPARTEVEVRRKKKDVDHNLGVGTNGSGSATRAVDVLAATGKTFQKASASDDDAPSKPKPFTVDVLDAKTNRRVRSYPFESREDAEPVVAKLEDAGYRVFLIEAPE
jgi:hypothetical protein